MGKGHWRRPSDVDQDTFRSNWDRIFNVNKYSDQLAEPFSADPDDVVGCGCKGDYATASGVCPSCGGPCNTT